MDEHRTAKALPADESKICWLAQQLRQHDATLRDRVEQTWRTYNPLVRNHIRTETALRLGDGTDTVPRDEAPQWLDTATKTSQPSSAQASPPKNHSGVTILSV